jgi:hypothetical protein
VDAGIGAAGSCRPAIAHDRGIDAMHGVLVQRADALEGCPEGPDEEAELKVIVDAIEAYEVVRWPLGKDPGGKG